MLRFTSSTRLSLSEWERQEHGEEVGKASSYFVLKIKEESSAVSESHVENLKLAMLHLSGAALWNRCIMYSSLLDSMSHQLSL